MEVAASSALQYAALAVGMAVLWGALLQDAGSAGNNNLLWLVEGVLTVGMVHAVMNSAFYGRFAGLAAGMMPSADLENLHDPELPYPRDPKDKLSRLNYRYAQETKRKWYVAPFGNVFSWKRLLCFGTVGILGGFFVANPNSDLRFILALASAAFVLLLSDRSRRSNRRRFASLKSSAILN